MISRFLRTRVHGSAVSLDGEDWETVVLNTLDLRDFSHVNVEKCQVAT